MRYPDSMRIIYSTPRLENAERIGQLLDAEGIGVRLLYGPHFRRNTWKGANYRQGSDPGNWPRVMVLSNGDLPRARGILRDAGILPRSGFDRQDATPESPMSTTGRASRIERPPPVPAARVVRVALIATALIVGIIQAARHLA